MMTSFDYNYQNTFRCTLCYADLCHARDWFFTKETNTECQSEGENFRRATGQSNLAYKQLAATSFQTLDLYSYNCTLTNGAVFYFDCPVARQSISFLATAHDCETDL